MLCCCRGCLHLLSPWPHRPSHSPSPSPRAAMRLPPLTRLCHSLSTHTPSPARRPLRSFAQWSTNARLAAPSLPSQPLLSTSHPLRTMASASVQHPTPKQGQPEPKFEPKEQPHPGLEHKMDPLPDYGETTYKGYNRLTNKVALITGGDSGIGRAVAVAFAREGADIAIQYLEAEQEDAKEVERVVKAAGRKFVGIPADFSEPSSYQKVVDAAVKQYGRIDFLILNAAFQGKQLDSFTQLDYERVNKAFHVNIISQFMITKYAIPHINEGGAIVTTSSIQAYQPNPQILDYASTKGAIVAFTKGLAKELAPKGIRANTVAPGPVWTPLIQASFKPEKQKETGAAYPISRPAQPVELAPSYVFLCSTDSHYINGEVLGVTGGQPLA